MNKSIYNNQCGAGIGDKAMGNFKRIETGIPGLCIIEPTVYGDFLSAIFEKWVRQDVGSIFVMNFEWALSSWMGQPAGTCNFAPRCGRCVVIEHNGDIDACDHYVFSLGVLL